MSPPSPARTETPVDGHQPCPDTAESPPQVENIKIAPQCLPAPVMSRKPAGHGRTELVREFARMSRPHRHASMCARVSRPRFKAAESRLDAMEAARHRRAHAMRESVDA